MHASKPFEHLVPNADRPPSLGALDLSQDEVRDRFAWAIRQGNPHWLWPDISLEGWRNALLEIEDVTRQILSNGRTTALLSESANNVCVAAFTSGMGPLLSYWGARGLFQAPHDVLAILDLHHRHNALRMDMLAARATEAVESLASHGVGVTVLKGMQTAFAYFPTPSTRPIADIDFLIDEADKEMAGEVLSGLGYLPGRTMPCPPQQSWRLPTSASLPRSLMLTHCDDPWYIDLQTALSRRYSDGARMIQLDSLRTPDRMERWALSRSASALSPTAMVLHLACHAGCGLHNLMLVRLTELVLVVRKSSQERRFTWGDFIDLAQETGSLPSAFPALCLAERLCSGTVPEAVLETAEMHVPVAVRRVLRQLRPASAQRVLRWSLKERFMWTNSLPRLLRQVVAEIVPIGVPPRELLRIYNTRLWRLVRGTLTLQAPDGS
jgi:hypothetical protein